jgi:aspartate aminotransferase-like enzyme
MLSKFRIPGPTPLPPAVIEAMQKPMIPHRGAEMKALYTSILDRTRAIHRTSGDVLIWPGSGSAGWEIAIVNFLSPGDTVICLLAGAFAERFHDVGKRFGLNVVRVEAPWGGGLHPDQLRDALARHPEARAVFITHNETSTGVCHPLEQLAMVARESDALVFVDAVSSMGGLPLEMDAWGVDYVMSGSQKAWMCPPGLTIVAAGERCQAAYERSTFPKFFWDFAAMKKAAGEGSGATTPPLSLLYAFDAALNLMLTEGIEQVWARHASLGAQMRAGVDRLGLRLFADPAFASNTVTAILMPDGVTSASVIKALSADYGIDVASWQGKGEEQVIRVGHMGWCDAEDLEIVLDALAEVVPRLSTS